MPTLEGEEVHNVKSGTQSGARLLLRGKGIPKLRGNRRGDLYAHVEVDIPRKLSKDQRRLFEQLGTALDGEPRSSDSGLFSKFR